MAISFLCYIASIYPTGFLHTPVHVFICLSFPWTHDSKDSTRPSALNAAHILPPSLFNWHQLALCERQPRGRGGFCLQQGWCNITARVLWAANAISLSQINFRVSPPTPPYSCWLGKAVIISINSVLLISFSILPVVAKYFSTITNISHLSSRIQLPIVFPSRGRNKPVMKNQLRSGESSYLCSVGFYHFINNHRLGNIDLLEFHCVLGSISYTGL